MGRESQPRLQRAEGRYYAEVPALALSEQSLLIEQLIGEARFWSSGRKATRWG